MALPRCPYCRELFESSRYHPDQVVCSGRDCQRRRRGEYHRQKLQHDPHNPQIVKNGGPADVQEQVARLGVRSKSTTATVVTLSSGVHLISKPSELNVPPWQLVSSLLDGASLRAATWWAEPKIPATTTKTRIGCWDSSLAKPGAVAIAKRGRWAGKTFGLTGGPGPDFNHAKIGVSTTGTHYAIFGDMNQQGAISGNCASSQNGRGGLFYVIDDQELARSVGQLIGLPAPKPQ